MNIKEIARQAQVSVATVSRVLNHPELVQPETRAHILEVMARHNYTPNWFARRLNLARTNTIALLVPNIEGGINQKVVAGVESVATKKGAPCFYAAPMAAPRRRTGCCAWCLTGGSTV